MSLVIISIGVLGIAAMQASALSSTHSSQIESFVAIQARSLADAMQANPGYWLSNIIPADFTVDAPASGATAATISGFPVMSKDCSATGTCTAQDMAAYDVYQWGKQLTQQAPGTSADIKCAGSPVICTIQLSWTQKSPTSINKGTQSSPDGKQTVYTLVNQL